MEKKVEKYFILEGVFSLFYILLTQGAIFTGLAIKFNLDEFQLGIAASIPVLMQVFQLISSRIMRFFSKRSVMINIFNGISRYSFSFLIVFLVMNKLLPSVFILFLTISQIFAAIAGSVWASWMKDLIPNEERGRIFAARSLYTSLATSAITYLYSVIADHLDHGFEIILIISALGSTGSILMMRRIPDVPVKITETGIPISVALKDENFVKYLIFRFYWGIAVSFSAPYYIYHLIKNLYVNYTFLAYISILTGFVAMVIYHILRKVSDDIGHKTLAEASIIFIAGISYMWFFMNGSTYKYLIWVDAISTGVFWPMMNLALMVLPLEVAFGSDPIFFGLNAVAASAGAFIGSILGGIVSKAVSGIHTNIFGFELYGIQLIFLIAGTLRLSALAFISRVRVRKHTPLGKFFVDTTYAIFRRPIFRVFDRSVIANLLIRNARKLRRLRRSRRSKNVSDNKV
ncbi:MAG: MFS transporter [Thermotogaceae bacterium]|nr:MFS transporter [Thermotogaceae bacterium]